MPEPSIPATHDFHTSPIPQTHTLSPIHAAASSPAPPKNKAISAAYLIAGFLHLLYGVMKTKQLIKSDLSINYKPT